MVRVVPGGEAGVRVFMQGVVDRLGLGMDVRVLVLDGGIVDREYSWDGAWLRFYCKGV